MTGVTAVRSPRLGEPLTAAEVLVLGAIARGLTRRAVAKELRVCESVVTTRTSRIAVKLGVCDRAGMVAEAVRVGQLRVERVGSPPERLDGRLLEVLVLIAAGKSNQDIARALFLSEEGVQSRIRFLYLVLNARSRAHAVALGVRCGALVLVPLRPNSAPVSIPASRTPGDLKTGNGPSRASQAVSGALRPVPGAIPSRPQVPR